MLSDLSELSERLQWCRQKSVSLADQISRLASASVRHWIERDETGAGEVKGEMVAEPPVSIRSEIGMIVNEQRAILDGLASTLARRNGFNDVHEVYFPICKNKALFFNKQTQKKIRKLSVRDRKIIEDLNPWQVGLDDLGSGNKILYMLHDADRVRKHQKLLTWACQGGVMPVGNGSIKMFKSEAIIFTEVGLEERLAIFENATTQLRAKFTIIYTEPEALNGQSVTNLLDQFNQTVENIIESFS